METLPLGAQILLSAVVLLIFTGFICAAAPPESKSVRVVYGLIILSLAGAMVVGALMLIWDN